MVVMQSEMSTHGSESRFRESRLAMMIKLN